MQMRVGSHWIDHEGHEFVIDAIGENGAEVWVSYHRRDTNIHYRCLAEAFTHRFREITQ